MVGSILFLLLIGYAIITCEPTPVTDVEVVEVVEINEPVVTEPITATTDVVLEKHTFRVTAYCSCVKCCGKWAKNRKLDEYGDPIVKGASGERLIPLVSVASPLPFGTEIELDTIGTVVVHDRTADWIVDKHGQYILDLYFSNHSDAWDFGVKYLEGAIKK